MTGLTVPQRVGQRIREARTAAGMTQAELGEQVGVTAAQIAHLEAGVRDTTVTRFAGIVQVLHLDLRDLFGEEAA
jgi:putative transcriptional regulator